jgi:hypothetical protein
VTASASPLTRLRCAPAFRCASRRRRRRARRGWLG